MKRKQRPSSASAPEAEESDQEDEAQEAKEQSRKKGKKKKSAGEEPVPADLVDKDEDGEEDEEEDSGELDVEFDFCDPDEQDYHSVRDLLKSGTWEFVELNYSELADTVVGQGNIGTLIKSTSSSADSAAASDVDETVCALLTALNLRQFPEQSWPKVISEALVAKARKHAEHGVADQLQALLERKDSKTEVGLLFSERFVNLPLELLPPFHKALKEDIEWSLSTPECPKEERPFYQFTHFIGVARCHSVSGGRGAGSEDAAAVGKKRRKGTARGSNPVTEAPAVVGLDDLSFDRPEDKVYVEKALFHFSFPMPTSKAPQKKKGGGMVDRRPERRVVFAISRKVLDSVIKDLPEALAELP